MRARSCCCFLPAFAPGGQAGITCSCHAPCWPFLAPCWGRHSCPGCAPRTPSHPRLATTRAGEEEQGEEKRGEEGDGAQPLLKTWAVSIKSADKVNELIQVVKLHKGEAPAAGDAEGDAQV